MSINSRNGNTAIESGSFPPVRCATTAAIVLTGLQTIDTIVLVEGDRVLVMDQADATQNGLYAASSGTWVRTSDAAGNQQFFSGMAVIAALGAVNGGETFLCTCSDDPVVVGTSAITFASQSTVITAQQSATSTTSLTIGTGAKVLATQSGKAFAPPQWVLIYETANPANEMLGQISSYAGGSLGVNVTAVGGAGTLSDWTIVLTNSAAAAGLQPPVGTGNVTGPGVAGDGNFALFSGTSGQLIKDSGKQVGALASLSSVATAQISSNAVTSDRIAPGAAAMPFVNLTNLVLANDASNPLTDVTCSAGRVRDDSDATNLHLAGTMLKRLDQGWAAGGMIGQPRVGALDTGARGTNKTYHWFLIGRLGLGVTQCGRAANIATLQIPGHGLGVGGTARNVGVGSGFDGIAQITAVTANTISYANPGPDQITGACSGTADGFDLLASLSPSAPTLPSGWTVKQVLWSTLTDGTPNNRAFVQIGDENIWTSPPALELDTVAVSGVPANATLNVPSGVNVLATIDIYASGALGMWVYPTWVADLAPSTTAAPLFSYQVSGAGGGVQANVWTDLLQRVRYNNLSNSSTRMSTMKYRDPRRRLF